jgi:hypothetical protein
MNERFSVRLGNPVAIFFSSSAMLLTGIVIGVHWQPSRAWVMASGVAAGLFMVAHELVSGLMWCSITAWWIRRRADELKDGNQR